MQRNIKNLMEPMSENEWYGFWTIPSLSESPVPGHLVINESEHLLRVFGFTRQWDAESIPEISLILGSSMGVYFSLLECRAVQINRGHDEEAIIDFAVSKIIKNAHIDSIDEAFIERITARVDSLERWINTPYPRVFFRLDTTNQSHEIQTLSYKFNQFDILLEQGTKTTHGKNKKEETRYIRISVSKSDLTLSSIGELSNALESILALFSTLTAVNISPKAQILRLPSDDLEFRYFYCDYKSIAKRTDSISNKYLIDSGKIISNFQDIFNNWSLFYKPNLFSIRTLLDLIEPENVWLEEDFLSVIRCLEGLHRSNTNNIAFDPAFISEYIIAIDETIKNLSPTLHNDSKLKNSIIEHLSNRLQHINEPTLKQRIKQIIIEIDSDYLNEKIKLKYTKIKTFCYAIKEKRDSFTHLDSGNQNEITYHDFYTLKTILHLYILKLIGIKTSQIFPGKRLME